MGKENAAPLLFSTGGKCHSLHEGDVPVVHHNWYVSASVTVAASRGGKEPLGAGFLHLDRTRLAIKPLT